MCNYINVVQIEVYLLLKMSYTCQTLIECGSFQFRGQTDTVVGQQPLGEHRRIAMLDYPVLELFKVCTFTLRKEGDTLECRQTDISHIIRLDYVSSRIVAV